MSVSFDFVPSLEWHLGTSGGAPATASDFSDVLSNLTGLFIRGEYSTGLVETPGLDNARLIGVSAVPEPSSLGLMAIAAVGIVRLRQSRRNRDATA
jgi:hypothetical protein